MASARGSAGAKSTHCVGEVGEAGRRSLGTHAHAHGDVLVDFCYSCFFYLPFQLQRRSHSLGKLKSSESNLLGDGRVRVKVAPLLWTLLLSAVDHVSS